MLKTLQIKLLPDDKQREALIGTFVKFNGACNSGIDNLGIIPIFMNETSFCKVCSEIIDDTICPHSEKDRKRFSGTLVRSIFSDNRIPEPEIMRKEVYEAVNRLRIEKG